MDCDRTPNRFDPDWLTLERSAVRAVLDFTRTRTQVMRHYHRTIIPSESLFATVLETDPSISVGPVPPTARLRGGLATPPRTFRVADVEGLLSSGRHFARKFDEQVDVLARWISSTRRAPRGG